MESCRVKCWDELSKGTGSVKSHASRVKRRLVSEYDPCPYEQVINMLYMLILGDKGVRYMCNLVRHMCQTDSPYVMGNLS